MIEKLQSNFLSFLLWNLYWKNYIQNSTKKKKTKPWLFREVVGLKTFSQLFQSIGTFGLTGLDKLYSFMIVHLLQKFTEGYRKSMKSDKTLKPFLEQMYDALEPISSVPSNSSKIYSQAISKISNLSKLFTGNLKNLWFFFYDLKLIN